MNIVDSPGWLEYFEDPVNILADITRRYAAISEEDLDIAEIYKQREEHNDREIMFD